MVKSKTPEKLATLHTLHSILDLNAKESLVAFKDTAFAKDYQTFKEDAKVVFTELINFVTNAKTL
ncbi:hypothetical protein [Polaribacter ponticola]|uniref:Uncharacterized protein n=1 Tax=Polaribacter ponticola TaxID=2978475 RepID=A0ABT5S4A8_9FLAO|nr:hypothetical protein [Polaribacter sp. MSW5]MDD7912939.1 hypothetical protein [Polaribacter sp. MSW5]